VRAFDGGATGTTPYRAFFKDGVFRRSPYEPRSGVTRRRVNRRTTAFGLLRAARLL